MSNELQITNYEFKNKKLQSYTNNIFKQGLSIKKSYARIAVTLAKIELSKCYVMDGFESVHDYSRQVLGINKSTSYAFLKIGNEFIDQKSLESVLAHDENNDFSISQLQALLPLKSVDTAKELAEARTINPDMSVKEIKEVVKNVISPSEEKESTNSDISDGGIIEVTDDEIQNFTVESILELATDKNGNKVILYGDVVIDLKEAESTIKEWLA